MPTRSVHVRIAGRVQGVGYRAWCADEATARGLSGWVRNRRSGDVEAVFSGPGERVDDMLEACRRGPWGSRVTAVDVVTEGAPAGRGFRILATE